MDTAVRGMLGYGHGRLMHSDLLLDREDSEADLAVVDRAHELHARCLWTVWTGQGWTLEVWA